jgi:hypothetical protein
MTVKLNLTTIPVNISQELRLPVQVGVLSTAVLANRRVIKNEDGRGFTPKSRPPFISRKGLKCLVRLLRRPLLRCEV